MAAAPKDPPTWQRLADNSKVVSESIKKLVAAIRDEAPGQSECDEAIVQVNQLIKLLDQVGFHDLHMICQRPNSPVYINC